MKTRKSAKSGTKRKRKNRRKAEPPRLKVAMPGKTELQAQLDRAKGNLTQVAAGFGVHRSTIRRWIAKLGIVGVGVAVPLVEARTPTIPFAAGGPPPAGPQPGQPVAASAADETDQDTEDDMDGTATDGTRHAADDGTTTDHDRCDSCSGGNLVPIPDAKDGNAKCDVCGQETGPRPAATFDRTAPYEGRGSLGDSEEAPGTAKPAPIREDVGA